MQKTTAEGPSIEPIDALGQLILDKKTQDGLDMTDPDTRRAVVDAVKKLSYCRDTMALVQYLQQTGNETYGAIRNTFSPEKDD